ncbi:MAG: glycoside hydrolase family 3 protein, partial [Steroidobacterales bacterium]
MTFGMPAENESRPLLALVAATSLALVGGCSPAAPPSEGTNDHESAIAVHPPTWPAVKWPLPADAALEARVQALIQKMTLEEKVGQLVQGDINSMTPDDMRKYHLGSVLAGGGSSPGGDEFAPPAKWLALADAFYAASIDTSNGGVAIPSIWGIDAMHGHSNIIGATLFPHNIGLGAMRDPDLIQRIGEITAIEVRATGIDWTFAPTVTVPQDDRWGRTYEGFSESPDVVASYAGRMVIGLQGEPGKPDFLDSAHVLSSAKHFLGDGGTYQGRDQGDTRVSEGVLSSLHAAGYRPAIAAGVETIMASYSSWNGVKMHGSHDLLTDVLKGRMDFQGFIVGDWNGHGQVPGCSNDSCAQALNAGLDMFMAPDSWLGLYKNLADQVRSGVITKARLDDAVARILRVKLQAHVFEEGLPSKRALAGKYELLGSAE